jgi:hypothetical protein
MLIPNTPVFIDPLLLAAQGKNQKTPLSVFFIGVSIILGK